MAIELAPGGSLYDVIHATHKAIPEETAKNYARSLLKGLAAIHDVGMAHRDIKPGNALVLGDGTVKISDFGLSCFIDSRSSAGERNRRAGTEGYKAPEMFLSKIISNPQPIDVYAMGVSIWQLFRRDLATNFHRNGMGVTGLASDLIFKMTEPDPAKRLTAKAALKHSWFTGIKPLPAELPKPKPKPVVNHVEKHVDLDVEPVRAPVQEAVSHHEHHHHHGLHELFHWHHHHKDEAKLGHLGKHGEMSAH